MYHGVDRSVGVLSAMQMYFSGCCVRLESSQCLVVVFCSTRTLCQEATQVHQCGCMCEVHLPTMILCVWKSCDGPVHMCDHCARLVRNVVHGRPGFLHSTYLGRTGAARSWKWRAC
eukprot:jgi/Ulvmu1/11803/UM080_0014.1